LPPGLPTPPEQRALPNDYQDGPEGDDEAAAGEPTDQADQELAPGHHMTSIQVSRSWRPRGWR
jgi:hypothetical protein